MLNSLCSLLVVRTRLCLFTLISPCLSACPSLFALIYACSCLFVVVRARLLFVRARLLFVRTSLLFALHVRAE